jgi:Superfamily I DNA and RNA helicases
MGDLKLVIAPPGAGKTRRLVESISAAINAGEINPYQVTPITFTREGAMEITRRLKGDVTARTCHALGYFIINLAAKMRQQKPPHIVSEGESLLLMKRAIEELGSNVKPIEALVAHQAMQELGKDPKTIEEELLGPVRRYRQILIAEGAVDFSGILESATQELEDPAVLAYFEGNDLYIDEFQDTNPIGEWPFVKKLGSVSRTWTALGDPRQRIFGFRGADWDALQADFPPNVSTDTMTINHRSTPEICAAGNMLAVGDWAPMIPSRTSIGIPVRHIDAANPDDELDILANQVVRWYNAGTPLKEIAVLARLHEQIGPIERILRGRGISTTLAGNRSSLFEKEETRALLAYIKLAIDPMREDVIEDFINFPPAGFGNTHRFRMRSSERLEWNDIMIALANRDEYPEHVIKRIGEIVKIRYRIRKISFHESPDSVIKTILDASGITDYLTSEGDSATVRALESLALDARTHSLDEFSEYLEQEIERPRVSDGVVLSTLHAAKGREWPCVIMPGMQEGILPHSKSDESEERNLAFVGVTRAKDQLLLLSNDSMPISPYVIVAKERLTKLK